MTARNEIERLFKTHYAQMFRVAVGLLRDNDAARDIDHDVFLSLLGSSDSSTISGSYLLKAVRNRCLNHIRNCDTRQRIANCYFLEDMQYYSEDWPDEEMIAQIYHLIKNEVSPQARRVIELGFTEGKRFGEIAKEMGISETAVYRHLSHALKIIRKKLNENG